MVQSHSVGVSPDVYHSETSPALLRMGLLLRGLAAGRAPEGRAARILELGCGQGLSLTIHAAAAPGEYWGVDDNPDNILRARDRANAAGIKVHWLNKSLAEVAADKDLPVFDAILLPNVWSPAGQEGRRRILEILDGRLATGGLVYVAYAALPGWYAASGPRDLAALLFEAGKKSPLSENGALSRLAELAKNPEGHTNFFAHNPEARELTTTLRGTQGLPLCFLPDWKPSHFAEMARSMSLARLGWGGPARPLDGLDAVNVPASAAPLLAEQDNPVLRETLRDYLLNRNERHDVFIKGERRLNQRENMAAVGGLRVGLTRSTDAVPASFASPLGACELKEDLYRPLLAALAADNYAPKTVEELEDSPLLEKVDSATLIEALTVLTGLGVAHPGQGHAAVEAARPCCAALNTVLLEQARAGEPAPCLASPVLGAGVGVSGLEQLFLASMQGGGESAKEWGDEAWAVLGGQGRQLIKEGATLDYQQSETEMTVLAEAFAAERLPVLQALGIVPENKNGEKA